MYQTPQSTSAWLQKRFHALHQERTHFDEHVRAVAENLLPRHSRFHASERNRGGDRNQKIIDSAGTQALRVLSAGMMAGMTSPARPWFRLGVPDPEMEKDHAVKKWLHTTTSLIQRVFRKSNTYNMLHHIYRELGGFGTGAVVTEENFERVVHHTPLTFGEYYLALNNEGRVDTLGREFELSVDQAAAWFGLENLSQTMQNAYNDGNYEQEVVIRHLIDPRSQNDRDLSKRDARNAAYRSMYWEVGKEGQIDQTRTHMLRESGYRRFPGLAPRWDVLYNDTYGSSPGMEALGDLLQLQQEQYRKAQGIDYMVDPPLQVPHALANSGADLLPGGVSYYDGNGSGTGIRTAFEVRLDLQYLIQDIQEVKQRINSAFYADMFLMLSTADRSNMTATEVAERHEEKLLMLGPVLERLHNELLEPLVANTFMRLVEANVVPPPPPALQGMELQIEFVSMLAQAQRAVGVNSVDRLVGHIGAIAQMNPNALDKFDFDKSIDEYSDMLGVNPDLIVAGEQVALVRQERAAKQAQQEQLAAAEQASSALANAGSVQTGPDTNAGADILNLFSGYQSPGGTEL